MTMAQAHHYGGGGFAPSSAEPKVARWDHAKKSADSLTALYTTPPIPVLEIAESNGVNVVFADFGKQNEMVAGFCDFKTARLYVNKDDRVERQFFTIAHEFGHWMLHRDLFLAHPEKYPVLPRFQNVPAHTPMEQEANYFAANLLVPARLLRPVMHAPVTYLANIFRVSKTMMEYRVKNVRA
ncbi:ImmA/IrrE family metallo-endopeptidase [Ensifer sp. ZNC0028]|uniref:ImmA/IrrE family metallo-endopeptidase n=1 Tax=Ensifer sp. ZNC0028 TaxID=1339236 RepID=UPI00068D8037|nr:ImmA/IrrE family metallo-endopeptidase [Ensifer sp. ZNC0028]